ncbi:MAG: M56 family metallopeptidase [Bacteroidota bacterium]
MLFLIPWAGFTAYSGYTQSNQERFYSEEANFFSNNTSKSLTELSDKSLKLSELDKPKDTSWTKDLLAYFGKVVEIVRNYNNQIALMWLVGVILLSLYLLIGLLRLKSLRSKNINTHSPEIQKLCERLVLDLGIGRKISVLISNKIVEPITFHFFKPVILLPIAVYTGLDFKQIEIIILHELAHIKRHDYLFNLIQSLIEILFFYHPAIWILSVHVREEREYCCDDWVTKKRNQDFFEYANTLTAVKRLSLESKSNIVMATSTKRSGFHKRINRILGVVESPSLFRRMSASVPIFILLFFSQSFMMVESIPLFGREIPKEIGLTEKLSKPEKQREDLIAGFFEAIHEGNLAKIQANIDLGVNPNVSNGLGRTALIEAAHFGKVEIVKYLIEQGANVNHKANDGYTALHESAEHGHVEILTHLLKRGALIDLKSKDGQTALGVAIKKSRYQITAHLISAGADLKIKNRYNKGFLKQAIENRDLNMIHLLSPHFEGPIANNWEEELEKQILLQEDRRKYSKPTGSLPRGVENSIQAPIYEDLSIYLALREREMKVKILLKDLGGDMVAEIMNETLPKGKHIVKWNTNKIAKETYWLEIIMDGRLLKQRVGKYCDIRWARFDDPEPDW